MDFENSWLASGDSRIADDNSESVEYTPHCTLGDDTKERWAVDDVNRHYLSALDNERRSSYMYNTTRHRCRGDAVWDGRDALLIESKFGVVEDMVSQGNYDKKAVKEDSAKAFTDSLWAHVIEEGKKRNQTYMVAKSIATLTVLASAFADWNWLEEQVSPQKYKEVRDSVFRSFAKFVLSVFCMVIIQTYSYGCL